MWKKIKFLVILIFACSALRAQSLEKLEKDQFIILKEEDEFGTHNRAIFFIDNNQLLGVEYRLDKSNKFHEYGADVNFFKHFYELKNNSLSILAAPINVIKIRDSNIDYVYNDSKDNYYLIDNQRIRMLNIEREWAFNSILPLNGINGDFSNKVSKITKKTKYDENLVIILSFNYSSNKEGKVDIKKINEDNTIKILPYTHNKTFNSLSKNEFVKEMTKLDIWDAVYEANLKLNNPIGIIDIDSSRKKFAINNAKKLIKYLPNIHKPYSRDLDYGLQKKISQDAIDLLNEFKNDKEGIRLSNEIKSNLKKYYEVEKSNLLNKQKKEIELENNKRKIAFQHEKAVYERKLREFAKAKNQAILDFKRIYRREQNIYEKNIFEKNWAIEFIKIGRPPRLDLLVPINYIRYDEEVTKPEPPPEEVKGNTASETVNGETDTYEAPVDPDAEGPYDPPKPAEDEIFTAVEQQAEFPGGPRAFETFLQKNLRYPSSAQRENVGGKVYVQFVVNTDGTIQDVQVLKSVGFGCDEEAVRIIKSVPRWTPGKQSGRAVRSRFTQPIYFILPPKNDKVTLKIGDQYGGGIVFYVDPITLKGLVVTKEDVRNGSTEWGCYCQDIKNTKTEVGSGQNNTKEILAQCFTSQDIPNWSAKIVNELVKDGFDDWYLPSKDELNLIYQNLHLKGLGNFSKTVPYWSSTQASYGSCGLSGGGWSQNFGTGEQIQEYKRGYAGTGAVRAIRSF